MNLYNFFLLFFYIKFAHNKLFFFKYMKERLKIKKENYQILKAYIQAQILLETLDDVEEESKMGLKHSTIKYKKTLEHKVEEVMKNTYNSNSKVFSEIMLEMKKYSDSLEKFFEII